MKVVLLDDNEDLLLTARMHLSEARPDWTIIATMDPDEAVGEVADVYVVDLAMPRRSGEDVAGLIRDKHGPEPALLIFTAHGTMGQRSKRLQEIGVDAVLDKFSLHLGGLVEAIESRGGRDG